MKDRGARIAIWIVALAIPPIVALSRIYRGMHHPLDALGGIVVGILALFVDRARRRPHHARRRQRP